MGSPQDSSANLVSGGPGVIRSPSLGSLRLAQTLFVAGGNSVLFYHKVEIYCRRGRFLESRLPIDVFDPPIIALVLGYCAFGINNKTKSTIFQLTRSFSCPQFRSSPTSSCYRSITRGLRMNWRVFSCV